MVATNARCYRCLCEGQKCYVCLEREAQSKEDEDATQEERLSAMEFVGYITSTWNQDSGIHHNG